VDNSKKRRGADGGGVMAEEWLIKGASVAGGEPADIHLKDGVIAQVGQDLDAPGASVLDAAGLIALPGLVDLHTHLREPGREDAETVETGTRAAALGGYTAVHAMANTEPVADTAGVVEQCRTMGDTEGLDALTGEYGDLIKLGVIDPIKVTRSALEHAASIAALLLTTDVLVAEEIQGVTGEIIAPGFGDLAEGLPRASSDAATPSL